MSAGVRAKEREREGPVLCRCEAGGLPSALLALRALAPSALTPLFLLSAPPLLTTRESQARPSAGGGGRCTCSSAGLHPRPSASGLRAVAAERKGADRRHGGERARGRHLFPRCAPFSVPEASPPARPCSVTPTPMATHRRTESVRADGVLEGAGLGGGRVPHLRRQTDPSRLSPPSSLPLPSPALPSP